jgi:phage terminase large subunit-like protein
MRNARKAPRPNQRYVLAKASQQQKIDSAVASIITHEAAGDVTAAQLWKSEEAYVYVR